MICGFDRWSIVEAYYWFDAHYAPTEYGKRLHRIRFSPGAAARFENISEDAKIIYGRLVMKHNRYYIGYERLRRRNRKTRPWPGTDNMTFDGRNPKEVAWLKRVGAYDAVMALTREVA